jgi:hypothetical protein
MACGKDDQTFLDAKIYSIDTMDVFERFVKRDASFQPFHVERVSVSIRVTIGFDTNQILCNTHGENRITNFPHDERVLHGIVKSDKAPPHSVTFEWIGHVSECTALFCA